MRRGVWSPGKSSGPARQPQGGASGASILPDDSAGCEFLGARVVPQIDEIALARGLQQGPDLVRRVPAVPAWRPHRADPALAGPVRHGPLRDLEEQRHLTGAQEPAVAL